VSELGDVTRLLREWREGQPDAIDRLVPLVYPDLRRIARGCLRRERPGHTLQPTALVHELYLRLCHQREANWNDRVHFFTFTARVMRNILADHARRKLRDKRGGNGKLFPAGQLPWVNLNSPEFLDLDAALDELERIDPRKARMIEFCHLLGCGAEEAAGLLEISVATAERDLKFGRGWLYRRLRPEPGILPS
jgi:RNA polymerase sigma factor (TIGR02999 family)